MADLLRRVSNVTGARCIVPIHPASFPSAFDPTTYRALHSDLWYLDDHALRDHYARVGRKEGRRSHVLPNRAALVAIVADAKSILEIGPSTRPLVTGPNVRYFDVVDVGEDLRQAGRVDDPAAAAPKIDYLSPTGDLGIVDRTFDIVISSHSIEHQPDLVGHLQHVDALLKPGGFYVVLAPDKRYCFDHFIPESSIGDVIEAAAERRSLHSLRSLVNQDVLTTHNEPVRHWAGDHGDKSRVMARNIETALELYVMSLANDTYVDRHAWQFTDESFETIIRLLNELNLISLPVLQVYPTTAAQHEFWAVLGPKPQAANAGAGAEGRPAMPQTAAIPRAGEPPVVRRAVGATWGVDSIQPQPNLIVVRGWSTPTPTAAVLTTPGLTPLHATIRPCTRREQWAPSSQQEREAGFIAVFPLERDLTLEQFTGSQLELRRTDQTIAIPILHIGALHREHSRAASSSIHRWIDTITDRSRVIEIGSRSRTSQSIRSQLKGSFLGIDIVPGSGVDVVADAHLLSDAIAGQTFTHAFSTSVFEHLLCPIQAVSELNAVLEIGGLAYIHCHQTWGYHEAPWDFFRFSDSAWRAIFNEVTGFEVIETTMGDEAIVVPITEWGNAAIHRQADFRGAYQTSTVLARKVGPSRMHRIFSAEDLKRVYPGFYPD